MKMAMQLIASPAYAIYLANLALTVTLVCAAGLLAIAIFRKKSAMLRHALLVSALILTLLAPSLVWLTCHNGFGLIQISFSQKTMVESQPSISNDSSMNNDFLSEKPANRLTDNRPIRSYTDISKEKDSSAITSVQSVNTSGQIPQPIVDSFQIGWNPRAIVMGTVSIVWLLGMIICSIWRLRGYVILRRFRRTLETPATGQIELAAQEAATILGLQRLPPIMLSAYAPTPLSLGLLRPLIVLPKNLPNEIDARQLCAVLIHETAHLIHRHHWIGLGQLAAGIMFWWNPLLHKINRCIMQLREDICDDHVLQAENNGQDFAKVLVQLATKIADLPKVPATIAIIDTGLSDLGQRIARLLDTERKISTRLNQRATVLVLLFGLMIALLTPFAGLRAEQRKEEKNDISRNSPNKALTPESGGIIRGRVIYAENEKPVPGILIYAQNSAGVSEGITKAITDEEGRYLLPLQKADKYTIWPNCKEYTAKAIKDFDIQVNETRTAPDILLINGSIIEGRLRDADTGNLITLIPGEEQMVLLYGPSRPINGGAVDYCYIKPDGSFRMRVAPGTNNFDFPNSPGLFELVTEPPLKTDTEIQIAEFHAGKTIEVAEDQTVKVELKVRRKNDGPKYANAYSGSKESSTVSEDNKTLKNPAVKEIISLITGKIKENYEHVKSGDVLVDVELESPTKNNQSSIVKWQQHVQFSGPDIRMDQSQNRKITFTVALHDNIWQWFTKDNDGGARIRISRRDALEGFMSFDPREYAMFDFKEDLVSKLLSSRIAFAQMSIDETGNKIAKISTFHYSVIYLVKTEYTFDSTVGYLPTVVLMKYNGNLAHSCEIEYQKISDGKAFFPTKSVEKYYNAKGVDSPEDTRWTQKVTRSLIKADLNKPIEKEQFTKIILPAGTVVDDQINDRLYETGWEKPEDPLMYKAKSISDK